MRTRLFLPAAIVIAVLLLSACSSSEDHDGMDGMGADGSNSMDMDSDGGGSTTTINIPDGADFNTADVTFAQDMIPHHAQAVAMADMALDTSTNDDVLQLAEQIRAAQSPEIEQMTTWLTDWDQSVPDAESGMGGSSGMSYHNPTFCRGADSSASQP